MTLPWFVWAIFAGTVTAASIAGVVMTARTVRYVARAVRHYRREHAHGSVGLRMMTVNGPVFSFDCRQLELIDAYGGHHETTPDGWSNLEVMHTAAGLVILQYRREALRAPENSPFARR